MLRGLALPKDMERVPQDLQPSLVHVSAYLVQVCSGRTPVFGFLVFPSLTYFVLQAGQALLQASNKATLESAERSRYRNDLRAEHEKTKTLRSSLKVAEAKAEQLKEERDEALAKVKKAERELRKVLRREKRKDERSRWQG